MYSISSIQCLAIVFTFQFCFYNSVLFFWRCCNVRISPDGLMNCLPLVNVGPCCRILQKRSWFTIYWSSLLLVLYREVSVHWICISGASQTQTSLTALWICVRQTWTTGRYDALTDSRCWIKRQIPQIPIEPCICEMSWTNRSDLWKPTPHNVQGLAAHPQKVGGVQPPWLRDGLEIWRLQTVWGSNSKIMYISLACYSVAR